MSINTILQRLEVCAEYIQYTNQLGNVQGYMPDLHGYTLKLLAEEGTGIGQIVEIGSYQGKSTCWLAMGSKRAGREKVTAVDHFHGSPEQQQGAELEDALLMSEGTTFNAFMRNIRSMGVEDYVTPIVATSQEAVKGWSQPIRLLFIDGDHTYDSAKLDFDLWSPFVVHCGLIAFHDIDGICGAWRFYNEMLETHPEYQQVMSVLGLNVVLKVSNGSE